MHRYKHTLVMVIALIFGGAAQAQENKPLDYSTIKFVGATYCPYFCAPGESIGPGFVDEIITIALERATGVKPRIYFKNRDDNRARASIAAGSADLSIGLNTTFAPNPRVSHLETSLFRVDAGLIKHVDDDFDFKGFDDPELLDKSLLWQNNVIPPASMSALVKKKHDNDTLITLAVDENSFRLAIDMIASKEVEMIIDIYAVLQPTWFSSLNRDSTAVEKLNQKFNLYLAHNNHTDRGKQLGKMLNLALIEMNADGTLERLKDKYLY